jgi:hypothetical protein
MNLFEFMSDSPILTFFIVTLLVYLVIGVTQAITGKYPKKDEED